MHGLLRRGRDASQGAGKACGGRKRGPYVSALTETSPPAACRGAHPPGRGPPAFRSPAAPRRDGTGRPGPASARSSGLRSARGRGQPGHPQRAAAQRAPAAARDGAGARLCCEAGLAARLRPPPPRRLGFSAGERLLLLRELRFKEAATRSPRLFPHGSYSLGASRQGWARTPARRRSQPRRAELPQTPAAVLPPRPGARDGGGSPPALGGCRPRPLPHPTQQRRGGPRRAL